MSSDPAPQPQPVSDAGPDRWRRMRLDDVQPAYDLIDRIRKEGPPLYLRFIAEQCLFALRVIGHGRAKKHVEEITNIALATERDDWSKPVEVEDEPPTPEAR